MDMAPHRLSFSVRAFCSRVVAAGCYVNRGHCYSRPDNETDSGELHSLARAAIDEFLPRLARHGAILLSEEFPGAPSLEIDS